MWLILCLVFFIIGIARTFLIKICESRTRDKQSFLGRLTLLLSHR